MFSRRFATQFDFFLFGSVLVLCAFGILGIYSAGAHDPGNQVYLRQLVWVGLGVLVCIVATSVNYRFLIDHAFFLYGCSILLLIGILFFGTEVNGSRSWISFGGLNFQPSEAVKIVVILALANYLADLNENYLKRSHFLALSAITMAPVVLIVLQGDLGTALMYFPILLGILAVAGLKMRFLAGALALALCVAPAGWLFLKDYQKERILATVNPDHDPQGIGYQTRQAKIAIGSGGLLGKGLGHASQSQLGFVPEIRTDFIFALIAEEKGFVGAGLILVLYFLILMRLIRIAETAQDRAGILVVTGVASLLFFHVIVNVGMTLGILPAIGIPLPLLSYGGSSVLSTFAAMGLALNVYYRRFMY